MTQDSSQSRPLAMLAAGGTGGHLFPAQALAEELKTRGYRIQLMTDERVRDYGKTFPAEKVHVIPAATVTLSDPLRIPANGLRLVGGILRARSLLRDLQPSFVAGFGGYPSFPPLVAARMLGIPTLLHEQNAVLGRANSRLCKRATRIAISFPNTRGIPLHAEERVVLTGNPVRSIVIAQAGAPYPAILANAPVKLFVFGGSQGAKFFSDIMPAAFLQMPATIRSRIDLVQQCRPEDMDRVRQAYHDMGMSPDLQPFFSNLPQRMAESHLVVCRSGASTIAELGVVGRPAILVPLPHSIDNDQLRNAQSFASVGAGWLKPQRDLTPDSLAAFLTQLVSNGSELSRAAKAALGHGMPEAAKALADVAESIAFRRVPKR